MGAGDRGWFTAPCYGNLLALRMQRSFRCEEYRDSGNIDPMSIFQQLMPFLISTLDDP
jgi:hypothetical protein